MLQLKSIFYVFEGATFNYYLINKYHTKMYIYPETDKKLYWIRKFYDNPIFQEVTWDYIKNTDTLEETNHILELSPGMNYYYICDKILNFCKCRIIDFISSNKEGLFHDENELMNYANKLTDNFIFDDLINFNEIICYDVKNNKFINLENI